MFRSTAAAAAIVAAAAISTVAAPAQARTYQPEDGYGHHSSGTFVAGPRATGAPTASSSAQSSALDEHVRTEWSILTGGKV